MRKADKKALRESIAHWKRVEMEGEEELGGGNCALCQLSIRRELQNNDSISACDQCIVKKKTGLTGCLGTPYSKWGNHHFMEHRGQFRIVLCPTCKELAHKEVMFLESLLPEN